MYTYLQPTIALKALHHRPNPKHITPHERVLDILQIKVSAICPPKVQRRTIFKVTIN